MSQMPSKIWLHKDTKYSTGDVVCAYQYDFAQGIEDEGGIKNFVEYAKYPHKCDKCGGTMRILKEDDEIVCPECKVPLETADIIMWD